MTIFTIGQVVYSKSGRDKGRAFVVTKTETDYVYCADGALRKVDKPKKKKLKHVQPVNHILTDIADMLAANKIVTDSDIRKAISRYCKSETNKEV